MKTVSKPNVDSLIADQVASMQPYIMFRIAKQVLELTPTLEAKGRKPIRMSIGAPTVSPPQGLLDKVQELLAEPGIHTYSVPEGEPYFRQAVAKRMQSRFKVAVDWKTEVCSLIGSKEGLAAMFRGVITPKEEVMEKDIILIPDPGYASYADAIKIAGGLPYSMPLTPENNYLPDMNRVMQELNNRGYNANYVKALILNYPSNPIGATAPLSYYEEVVRFAQEHNILIISDNAYSEMVFAGEEKPHSILEIAGAKDIAIEFHSLSKPYALTGWRIGFAVGNAVAINALNVVKSTMDSGLWKVHQKAAVYAMESPACEQFVLDMNKVYAQKQAIMKQGFMDLGWPEDTLNLPKATFYFWVPIPPRYTSCETFATELLETSGVVVVPGTAFGKFGEGFIRLSLVNPDEELHQVVERMKTDGFTYLDATA
ncbi:MAG: aminotransferase class I/II-fold pyridoxal phosphate-dependent enzyme [Vampirovibrionales bacterium]